MSCNILLTGASGWLGQFVYKHLVDINDNLFNVNNIFAIYNKKIPHWIPESNRFELDLTNHNSVEVIIKELRPLIVIHLAAMSAPSVCHKEPLSAESINCPLHLLEIFQLHIPNALFIFTSTDIVFDGAKGTSYLPNDKPNPLNIYGETKRKFEELVLNLRHGIVLRLSNIIGPKFVYEPSGCKFMQFLFEAYKSRQYIGLRDDEIRSFVSVYDVVKVIELLIVKSRNSELTSGIYHVGGPSGLSRLELASIVAKSDNNQLIIKLTEPNNDDNSATCNKPWVVFSISNLNDNQNNDLISPKNVTMDSSGTEQFLNFQFTSMNEAVPMCLQTFE